MYTCEKCLHAFERKSDYARHQNMKTDCAFRKKAQKRPYKEVTVEEVEEEFPYTEEYLWEPFLWEWLDEEICKIQDYMAKVEEQFPHLKQTER